ncbi:MAG: hypothetical protein JF600_15915 [Xanthomonadales bacterium]|nr:hypothetical protein [Xanthomonadales bacterium]
MVEADAHCTKPGDSGGQRGDTQTTVAVAGVRRPGRRRDPGFHKRALTGGMHPPARVDRGCGSQSNATSTSIPMPRGARWIAIASLASRFQGFIAIVQRAPRRCARCIRTSMVSTMRLRIHTQAHAKRLKKARGI